ncbi:MAG: hypothetical protein HOW97_27610 [Catenulispora sp.]|nr:hypothetical protein [Catenulispora sp.]
MPAIPVAPAIAAGPTEAGAAETGLTTLAEARWPESDHDQAPPPLPGFIVSSFSPIAAEAAARCLSRRPAGLSQDSDQDSDPALPTVAEAVVRSAGILQPTRTAVVIASARGDVHSAAHVAAAVDTAAPLGPLLFFQSVPNAVAGHIAARWQLTGPVVCVADRASALAAAALLIEDGDADEALVLHAEQTAAHAVLLCAQSPGGQP